MWAMGWETSIKEAYRAFVVSYADDFVILCRGHATEALAWTKAVMAKLGLALNEAKTSLKERPLWERTCLNSFQDRRCPKGPLFSRGTRVAICSGLGTGSGLSSSEFTRLKMAVFAPTPRARVSTAVAAKLGAFLS